MIGGTIKPKEYNFKPGDSLRKKADRSEYEPYIISDIDPSSRTVTFQNGQSVKEGAAVRGETSGSSSASRFGTRWQHFRRQEQLRKAGIKVLSLFFIDKVEN